jgi:hypothetical protein
MAAAADDVSLAISETFGTYGQQFQTISAQAAAYHNQFVSLLNGGATAYLSAELANAEQTMLSAASAPSMTSANATAASLLGGLLGGSAPSDPILGGLGGLLGGGTGGGPLGGLGGLLGGGTGGGPLGGLVGGLQGGFNQLVGGFSSLGSSFSQPLNSFAALFNPSVLTSSFNSFASLFNPNTFTSSLTGLTGPINFGNLTPGISLTSGPLGPLLGPTLNGIGLDLGNFLSNELVNGLNLSNLGSLFQSLLFGTPGAPSAPLPNPYVVLGDTTVINLSLIGTQFIEHPFPILNQININQNHYAQIIGNGLVTNLQGFPGNVPANIQLVEQGVSSFNPAVLGQDFVSGTTGFWGTVGTSLAHFGQDIQTTLPAANNDIGQAVAAIQTGNYYGAVQDAAHAPLDLFITGFDTSHLAISVTAGSLLPLPPTLATIGIAGPIGLEGPAADLLPILTAIGAQPIGLASLVAPGSIPGQILGNFANAIGTLTNANITADFAVNIGLGATLAGTATFGLPLQLGFAVLGPPFALLNGVAQGSTVFASAVQTGGILGGLNAIGDMPAYALNGLLNGQLLVDLPLPVAVDGIILPAIAHVPFDGLLTPAEPLSVTIPIDLLGIDIPINATLGGTEFGGLFPTLLNTIPEAIAAAITPA